MKTKVFIKKFSKFSLGDKKNKNKTVTSIFITKTFKNKFQSSSSASYPGARGDRADEREYAIEIIDIECGLLYPVSVKTLSLQNGGYIKAKLTRPMSSQVKSIYLPQDLHFYTNY